MQSIIESALICLLEPRQNYQLSKVGILDACVPARRIEVLIGATTLASIVISGLDFLKTYGVPNQADSRLLGKSKFAHWNQDGLISGFSNLSQLSPAAQNRKLENYNTGIKRVVEHFLLQFCGTNTFYLRPEMIIKLGAPLTILQSSMSAVGHTFQGYTGTGWKIPHAMAALSAQEIHDIAEVALTEFESVKGPIEIRTVVMRSVGIHLKELIGSAAYLNNTSDPFPYPSEQELEDWVGWNPALMSTLREIKDEAEDANASLEKMGVVLVAIMRKLKGLEAAKALRAVKEINLRKGLEESKVDNLSDLLAEDPNPKEPETNGDG